MTNIDESKFNFYKNEYEKNGYLIIENVYNKTAIDELKENSKEFMEPPDFPVALNVHRRSDFFMQTISDPKLIKLVEHVQNSQVDALNDQFLFKKANTKYGKQSWTFHQDNSYPKSPDGSYLITHVAIDRSEKENGGLIFLTGSHKEPILDFEHNISWKESSNKDGTTRPGQTIKDINKLEQYQMMDVVFPQGSICLMHGNLIHGSHPNLTNDQDRNQYSMCYLNKGVDFFEGRNSKKIRYSLY